MNRRGNDDEQDGLSRALDEATFGRTRPLYDLLSRGSHLPGTRMNEGLAEAFAELSRGRSGKADGVLLALARLSAHEAPGATALEFLPVCGVLGLAARAAAEPKIRARYVAELHARADDLRFRVRDAVVNGLARVGGAAGEALLGEVAAWMDGYFHAAAVIRATASEPWLSAIAGAAGVVSLCDDAFALLRDSPRAAARWPGHKALLDALRTSLPLIATRFGVPVFDMLVRWSEVRDPVLREVVAKALAGSKVAGRFGPEVARVRQALAATEPAPRNPDHDVGPTRDRSKNRRRTRR